MISDFLKKSDVQGRDFGPNSLGALVCTDTNEPIEEAKLVLVGCPEYRRAGISHHNYEPDLIRKKLFRLYPQYFEGKIQDLGNILPGATIQDTDYAIKQVLSEAKSWGKPVVFLGGSSDLILPILEVQEKFEQYYTALSVDYRIDFDPVAEETDHKNYLYPFFTSSPKFIFQYLHLGLQSYLQNQEILKFFSSVNYDATRLGKLRGDIKVTEPVFRQADLAFLDFSALKYAEAGATLDKNPNGFYAEEFCQMARYAGFSEYLNFFGLFGFDFDPLSANSDVTAGLAAEVLWCFMEGLSHRRVELPLGQDKRYKRYTVFMEDFNREIVFYKSVLSGRWWIEAPEVEVGNSMRNRLNFIPCGEEDYQTAASDKIPEAWWTSMFRS